MSHDEPTNWDSFRFPPRPPKRWDGPVDASMSASSQAPTWASPPRQVRTWHLDLERLLIIHPVQRKKIDLCRINTKHRLVQLTQLVRAQPNPLDVASLWSALDDAFSQTWSLSLPEILAQGPEKWAWPRHLESDDTDLDKHDSERNDSEKSEE